ncbi:MAG: isoquinoline 1-oxidoreductase alpha subunit [Myxococcota bacterium]
MKISLNGKIVTVDAEPDTPLLWVLRDHLGLTGTKFGCGIGACGSCTVHLDGRATRACTVAISAVGNARVTTIEGVSQSDDTAIKEAWIAEQAPQCGYCQPGMIMAATALLERHAQPTDAQIDTAITNLCRCGSYPRIRKAIHRAARTRAGVGKIEEEAP